MNPKKIPKGYYCYDKNGICPYWSIREDQPYQFNGYCSFLKIGDWENKLDDIFINSKTNEEVKGKDLPFAVSLLWDQVKECNINEE